ncbi:MAG: YhbY family RNA-binding protein [Sphaerochaeta sp.]|uniref:YhbY family RNA-binding protein n=1 Tax=Sphaerochaeta sp. S2 TaxID=2798868 RepID=UPI0018E9BDD7|nr:YhbY family RNA-binding protein [Sphaerochaeta sp. S2]MCK9349195.1 YhbY family RNA-binding protein [Sphaerochaeta sp.]MBJ2356399.1 YhbY family RNA-binding protein [Sphaerochaeta sp. S2]MDD4302411.1 YhbY family RNA-binding protein [Sphaerochaeta sp.]MDD4647652.1 YhbY family RNA-binding protein [Sphaerochaeta sp.]MDY0244541.1 YhbY family RNA-binding protein [Sphaerochaeta sp.]
MNSSVRNFLRSQAHSLKPIVMVGKEGVDDRVVSALNEALSSHELVKVKFQAQKDEMRPLSEQLAQKTDSDLISIIGFIATFYRESEEHLIHIPRELARKGE